MARLGGLFGTGAAVLLCLGISGCGGSDSSPTVTPTPTPAPTPPPPEVVLAGNFELDVNFVTGGLFEISSTGTIDVTVDYTFADSILLTYIAKGNCTFELFNADQCNYVATSFTGPDPRILSATNQSAGAYTHIVWNLGPHRERFATQVIFPPQAGAASRPIGSDISSRRTGEWTAPARRF